jgi:hypothetical protein
VIGKNRGRGSRRRPTGLGAFAAVLAVCLVVLAGCGGSRTPTASGTPTPMPAVTSQPTPVPAPTPAPAPPAPAVAARCDLPELTVAFAGESGAIGGLRVDTYVMTNTGRTACWLYGYAGMLMLGPTGNPMPTNVVRHGGNVAGADPGPSLVTLRPGASASFLAGWRAWYDGGTTCAAASGLVITPPDAYDHWTIPVTWGLAPCNGGEIDVTAVAPGTGT